MLPQLSGIEVCRRLRRRSRHRERADHHADRARRGDRPDPRPRHRRRRLYDQAVLARRADRRVRAVLRRVRPAFAEQLLSFPTCEWTSPPTASSAASARSTSARPSSACSTFPRASGPGVQPRAAARRGLGLRSRDRAAHGRRPHPPPAPGAQRRRRGRPDPHRPGRGLFARPQVRRHAAGPASAGSGEGHGTAPRPDA